jgi:hypothetical protein
LIVIEGRVLDLVPKPLRVWAAAAVLMVQPGCMCGCSAPQRLARALSPAGSAAAEADCPDCARAAERRRAESEG